MEDSDQRKQRLNAMRAMAAHNETSSSSTHFGTCAPPPFLANPLLDNLPMQDHLRATHRTYYNDMAASSKYQIKSKKDGKEMECFSDFELVLGQLGVVYPSTLNFAISGGLELNYASYTIL
ncbi:hypothetical protein Tsubulata_038266 [Turnera subulata]|uniref:Uncharacterized protein n=1 Tax=Turnera subulata TaxID=218843 RepID=A0A9Q0FW16_9ROSI|nr:hypothetical protein Tsubulata_038266 [Turnera subulata]